MKEICKAEAKAMLKRLRRQARNNKLVAKGAMNAYSPRIGA